MPSSIAALFSSSSAPFGLSPLSSGPVSNAPTVYRPDVILHSPLTVTPTPTPTGPPATSEPTPDPTPAPTVTVTQTVQPSAPAVQDVKLDADQFGAGILGLALLVTVSAAALVRGFRR